MNSFNFTIENKGPVSEKLLRQNIHDFQSAAGFVQHLPYKRNSNKHDAFCVLSDKGGTCSTKHALLKTLAQEQDVKELKLMLGIYRMNQDNTPGIGHTLKKYGVRFIPEAHNYLRLEEHILDFTFPGATKENFSSELMKEIEILPTQITDFKVAYHKLFLQNWLSSESKLNFTPAELWAVREECIAALQKTAS